MPELINSVSQPDIDIVLASLLMGEAKGKSPLFPHSGSQSGKSRFRPAQAKHPLSILL